MQADLNFNGATVFHLTDEYGKPVGIILRRNGKPDVKPNRDGLVTLAKRLSGMKHSLTNARITPSGKVIPLSEGSITTIPLTEYKKQQVAQKAVAQVQIQQIPQTPQQPQPLAPTLQPPKAPTQEQIEQFKHQLYGEIIKMFYGENADLSAYKVCYTEGKQTGQLRGICVDAIDYTTPELYADGKTAYAKIIYVASEKYGFTKSVKHMGAWVMVKNGITFSYGVESRAKGNEEKSILLIGQYMGGVLISE